ncbi:outer membrane lipid asymmetry maintenance protein MlaD [Marinobacter sp. X15-166B]|uniref:outer membrane lipid asymmetry maintenance protein MlaD n=1 Tax=Marinobacter sp. X15-166B TaxID=1897620 RepID=UPI00085CCE21|nr:outer membrane lipid asymmetry maintenance protein MlaD [Marinobacter sp. X15-166B]OEY65196.1 outer membrane lipid asymmetry maintenance protein MlaD [Marinobacter sp. X15-166B]
MNQRAIEIIVGLFMVAGFAALLFLALQVSGLSPTAAGSTYTVSARFNDAGGLAPRGKVSMAGVTVGTISAIELDTNTYQARVTMRIDATVDNIPTDSAAIIRTSGLLGGQYVDISVGADEEYMQDGDAFYATQSAMNLERIISNFASGK